MTNVKYFDWSSLDRGLIIKKIKKAGRQIIGHSLTPHQISKIFRKQLRESNIPVNVKTNFDQNTKLGWVYLSGLYDSIKDKKNRTFITINFHFNAEEKRLNLTYNKFRSRCELLADMIMHEIIHARQYRRRSYKDISGYASTAELRKQKNEQEYYGHNDEIDAYAFNSACELSNIFKKNRSNIIKYLNKDLSDNRLLITWYKKYLETFNHNHNHQVIKKLKKKIIYYLDYVELGKPYKTADWLKK